jgi:trimethylamine--corrinoid protein Co-methyltransferase
MTNPIKSITNPKLSINILTDEEVLQIHQVTLQTIASVGVSFPSTKALTLWDAFGADVDHEKQIVKVTPDIIENALKKAPPSYVLGARDARQDCQLDGNHVYLATDGCGVEVVDINTGKRRSSCLRDVADIARIADGTEEIGFHWVALSAQDKPAESRGLHEIWAVWQNSTKHVQTESIYNEVEAHAAVEMATVVAGGSQALRERPVLSLMQCTASPLGQDGGSIEAALIAAEAGIPIGFMTMAANLTTGPATLAGNLVVGNAEVLTALALIQMTYPGAPIFYAAAQTSSDLRTGAYTGGGPEDFLYGAASNRLADFYNLPLSMGAFATGAKEPNWQAGLENSLSAFMACVSMSDMLLGAGFLHGSRIWSYAQMLLDCEIFSIIHKMMGGIVVNEETLAFDAIAAAGPGGNFLSHPHTLQHMRELFLPKFMDRRPYNTWEEKGDDARDWALEKARKTLHNHVPKALDTKLDKELEKMILAMESKIKSAPQV